MPECVLPTHATPRLTPPTCPRDTVENLPDEVQREISSMRELDVRYQALLQDMEGLRGQLDGELDSISLKRIMVQIQDKLISTQEIGDDKLQIVQHILDIIENRQRQLELDCKNLDFGQEPEKPEASKDNQPERASKRARRTRNDHASNHNENSNDMPTTPHIEKIITNKVSFSVQNLSDMWCLHTILY